MRWKPVVNIGLHGEISVLDLKENVLYWHLKEPYHTAYEAYGWASRGLPPCDAAGLDKLILEEALDEFHSRIRTFVRDPNTVLEVNCPETWQGFPEVTGSICTLKTTGDAKKLPPLYELPLLVPEFFRPVFPDETTDEAWVVLGQIRDYVKRGLRP